MPVKLPSWLPRALAFWPTVIRAAHFPVIRWRMKAMWRHPTSLCLPASLEPYPLLCTRSQLRTLRTCHSQVWGEARKHTLHFPAHLSGPIPSFLLILTSSGMPRRKTFYIIKDKKHFKNLWVHISDVLQLLFMPLLMWLSYIDSNSYQKYD